MDAEELWDDSRQNGSDNQTKKRIFEADEQFAEFRRVGERHDGITHCLHSEHQHGETDRDLADVSLFLVFDEHENSDGKKGDQRSKKGRFEQIEISAAGAECTERENPRGRRCTDIGTHNDPDRL